MCFEAQHILSSGHRSHPSCRRGQTYPARSRGGGQQGRVGSRAFCSAARGRSRDGKLWVRRRYHLGELDTLPHAPALSPPCPSFVWHNIQSTGMLACTCRCAESLEEKVRLLFSHGDNCNGCPVSCDAIRNSVTLMATHRSTLRSACSSPRNL